MVGLTCILLPVLCQAMLMPLRGFLNSLVYGLRGRKPPLCCLVLARRFPCIGKIFFFESVPHTTNHPLDQASLGHGALCHQHTHGLLL